MRLLRGLGRLGVLGLGGPGLGLGSILADAARADLPFPTCAAAACSDPADFANYLFIAPGAFPNDYDPAGGEAWKYAPDSGMDIEGAWQRTTGRPDVAGAILDSGIRWESRDVSRTVLLNAGELPVPSGCASHDCDGNGFVSIDDFAAACAADLNSNGFCDGEDLIRFYSDGVDDDGNGYVYDIAGWDFLANDNDPDDDVEYGHGTGEAGDQYAEVNDGSGAYLVRAYRADGSQPAGWPKFTHGWHLSSATPGDVDGNGKVEIVATTREGNLFVWGTPGNATQAALPWAGYGRDRRNTKNGMSGVSNLAGAVDPLAGLGWALESIGTDLTALVAARHPPDSTLLAGSPAPFLIPRAIGYAGTSNGFKTS
jgi:hypothetical protein